MEATERVTVARLPERAAYDLDTIRTILGAGQVCHLGFVADGSPVVIAMTYGLFGDELVVHGLPASRLLGVMRAGLPVCVTVTHVDGLVLAKSAFEHSMNYRSAVVHGNARWIRDEDEKRAALRAISEQLLPGRWDDVRPPTTAELRRTHVLGVPLTEASAKVRTGPPAGDEDDSWPTWTGVLPVVSSWGTPEADFRASAAPLPAYLEVT